MSLWNQTAAELLDATASAQPTPGGGSVAALSGAYGAGLLSMALNITHAKALKKAQRAAERAGEAADLPAPPQALEVIGGVRTRLRALADEDVAVFRQFVAAARRPGGTPEADAEREGALAEASEAARAVPLEIARQCAAALAAAEGLAGEVHPEVVSDVGAGAALLRGAAQAALLTFEINLRSLSSDERARLSAQRDALERECAERAGRVLGEVRAQWQGDGDGSPPARS